MKKDRFAEREAKKYANPIPSREFILEQLTERGRPATYHQLLDEFDLSHLEAKEALKRRLQAMVRDGQLLKNRRNAYGPIDKLELIPGRVVAHKDGFGFVIPDGEEEDLYLNARQMRTVFHNDRVLARVSGYDNRGRREGVIVEVVERNTKQLVGKLLTESGITFVQPSNTRIVHEIMIPPDQKNNAESGQMVVVEILTQPSSSTRPLGKVIEVLGNHMAPGMEIDVAIRNNNLPHEWPEEVLREAASFDSEVNERDLKGRRDFRTLSFVTIDGEDAKDFDDAVYCERSKKGWTLYVAIADVSHYVHPNSFLDKEALNRGNSVYFPAKVIPMLPEALSNELCSLNPNVNRLVLVCEMSITDKGKITHYEFFEGVIESKARLTYNQVFDMIVKNDKPLQEKYVDLFSHLKELFNVYRILHQARIARGAIDFDLPETRIVFGAGRKIEKIVPLMRNDAHRMIEECMLCANICAATFLLKKEMPGLYRVHEGPTAQKLTDLHKFLAELDLKLPGKKEPAPSDYASLLLKIQDRPDAHLIQTVLLRSLSQAVYSHENIGHFGLAFPAYAHFTSPIRRYPDLLVHRAIRKILRNEEPDMDHKLEKLGEHCSMTERRADDATREAIEWLKCEYMLDKLGQVFDAVITAVTHFGLFVELKNIFVEGLLHISELQNDYYQFDPIKHALLGERSGKRYRLGDPIRVQVVRVDLDQREIDFVLPDVKEDKLKGKKRKSKLL